LLTAIVLAAKPTDDANKYLVKMVALTKGIDAFKKAVISGTRTSFKGYSEKELKKHCKKLLERVRAASIKFQKQLPKSFERTKSRAKTAKRLCDKAATEA